MLDGVRDRVRTGAQRLRRVERRELREFRRWMETTDHLVHLSMLVVVPLLIGLVTALANAVPSLTFLLFPPLASGTYTLFVDPTGKYSSPGRFVAGLTLGAACGLAALWVSQSFLTTPPGPFAVNAVAAGGAVLLTGLVTWPLGIEEPSGYATALLTLLLQPAQRFPYLGSIFLASSFVAVVFTVWRERFYDRRATYLYESTQGDDHVLVPMRGETPGRTALLGARLAAAHDAGKVVLLDLVPDQAVAAAERALLDGEDTDIDPDDGGDEPLDEELGTRVDALEREAGRIETRAGVPCEVVVAVDDGTPAATTLGTADAVNCDLVVAPYESEHGALTPYLRRLLGGDTDVLVHRSRTERTRWKHVLVSVRRVSDVSHNMVDFATRLAGRSGRVAVATCIGARSDRRRAEEMLADLVEPFEGSFETRVARTDIQSFLTETGSQYDLVVIGASQDRSAASRFVSPPTFERLDAVEADVAIVDRN
ncbi:HPP family protein [Haloarcula sp. GH36]|uniref:HPP family protein n=1 Tax=Haloarcula montana TaxID=3111776 RepID=UPI002D780BEA|nr:universal stress protein [Haloarcula sp. GH36]